MRVLVVDDEQLRALPENDEEEKEEILLPSLLLLKPQNLKFHHLKAKLLQERDEGDKTSSVDTAKQLERQATQLEKITRMLDSIQKDIKSTKGQSKLINQLQSQINQLQTQMSQIQKIAKRSFITATISSRKKIRPKKS